MGGASAASPVSAWGFPDRRLSCTLEDPGGVRVVPAPDAERGQARPVMATHHPRGDAACPGGRLRYWIRPSARGVPGGFTVGAASWRHAARDAHIGWPQAARDASIGLVVNNDRFLPLPGVRVHGLASPALSLPADRVAGDREARYGVRPVLACSFVGPGHTGMGCRPPDLTTARTYMGDPIPACARRARRSAAPCRGRRAPGWPGSAAPDAMGRAAVCLRG